LEVLTFGVELFLVPSARRGWSAMGWRTVRERAVRCVFFMFLLAFVFDLLCFCVLIARGFGRSACVGRTVRGCMADSPRAPRGRSVFRSSLLEVLLPLTDSPRPRSDGTPYLCGQPVVHWRTVRPSWSDGPLEPGCFVSWLDSSLLLSCFRVCFKESFLRLEVVP
jgi:hypothetical protein